MTAYVRTLVLVPLAFAEPMPAAILWAFVMGER